MALKCPVCSKQFEHKSNLLRHKNKHGGKLYTCEYCQKQFNDVSNRNKHIRGVHIKAAEHKCQLCDAAFKQKTHLQAHQLTHSDVKEFTCGVCSKEFSRKKVLETHMRTHVEDKMFECGVCDETFNHKSSLEFHMAKHTGSRGFTCEFCGRMFLRKGNFERHRFTHLDEKPFNCDICFKGFTQKVLLDSHVQKYHPMVKNEDGSMSLAGPPNSTRNPPRESYIFQCNKCDKKFNARGNLNRHVRAIHEAQPQQFSCKHCKNTYISKKFLDVHVTTEHKAEVEETIDDDMTPQTEEDNVSMDTEKEADRDGLNALQMVYSSVNIDNFIETNEKA